MREINNNVEIGKAKKPEVKQPTPEFEVETKSAVPEKEIKDLSNPTEVSGRSLVNSTDNLKNDSKFIVANPKAVDKAEKLFNIVFEKLTIEGNPHAYEIASSIATSADAKALLSK